MNRKELPVERASSYGFVLDHFRRWFTRCLLHFDILALAKKECNRLCDEMRPFGVYRQPPSEQGMVTHFLTALFKP
jgi:hypothetical protein